MVIAHSYGPGHVTTAPTCTEQGVLTFTCINCGGTATESIPSTDHSFIKGKCTVCDAADPDYISPEYYLVGYINGADYGCEADYENLGQYKFVNGSLVASFERESYVFIKANSNLDWYMTDGWQGNVKSVILYNTDIGITADKLFVPGGAELEFTLVDNGDDTFTLSYSILFCPHSSHDISGRCLVCGEAVEHSYTPEIAAPTCTEDGYTTYTCSACGDSYVADQVAALGHSYVNGYCSVCGEKDPDYVEVVVPTMTLNYPTLAFEAEILYNAYFTVSDASSVVEFGMVTFSSRLVDGTIADAVDM
ncbi:MAG: hypothetical protein IJB11_00645, partial [Oscillospiraceae bacterium]|nr:hypothetical protein [Oscillospiraceae bacterium]